jgi:hypothetical protein
MGMRKSLQKSIGQKMARRLFHTSFFIGQTIS